MFTLINLRKILMTKYLLVLWISGIPHPIIFDDHAECHQAEKGVTAIYEQPVHTPRHTYTVEHEFVNLYFEECKIVDS